MTFAEALKPYLYGSSGVVSLYAGGVCDNLFLFTAHAAALADRLGDDELAASLKYSGVLYAKASSIEPGLIKRRPDDAGANSYDEIFGACYLEWSRGGFRIPFDVYAYGMKHWFCYDVENPGKLSLRFFFARNVTFIPFVKACGRMKVGVIGQAAWTLGAWLSLLTPKSNTSGKLLIDLQILPMWRTGFIAKVGVQVWLYFMKRQYKSRKAIYEIYFPNHPLSQYQPNEWSLR